MKNEKLLQNTILKINSKVETLQKNYVFTHINNNQDWRKSSFEFICKDHGIFTLNGYEVRTNKKCPQCEGSLTQALIEKFNESTIQQRAKIMFETFPQYDWTDFDENDFINIDHTIRPSCLDHGEFITTSRKLINGQTCKWCDGVKTDENGNWTFKLDREQFQKEKINIYYENLITTNKIRSIEKIKNTTQFLVGLDTSNIIIDINKLKGNEDYKKHLSNVRNSASWNSIFFKIQVQDKSSKFQFNIVYYINLNEQWMKWYNDQLSKIQMDQDNAEEDIETIQQKVTNTILETWVNSLLGESFKFDIIWSFWNTSKRTEFCYNWYWSHNKDKEIILPVSLYSKFKIAKTFKEFNVPCYWSEFRWDSTSNSVSLIRESHLNKDTTCPICKKQITSPVVDHEHKAKVKGTGRIRATICSNCNVFIAKAENNCKRYGIALEELPEVLKNVSEYFTEQQYNIVHYTDKDSRPTLSKLKANKILKYWDFIYPAKKKKLKFPKSGIITKDWEEAIKLFDEFEKTPPKPFSKNDYKQLLKNIETYNNDVNIVNISLPKTKRKQLILIPEYPKTKMVTPEIQRLIDITKKV